MQPEVLTGLFGVGGVSLGGLITAAAQARQARATAQAQERRDENTRQAADRGWIRDKQAESFLAAAQSFRALHLAMSELTKDDLRFSARERRGWFDPNNPPAVQSVITRWQAAQAACAPVELYGNPVTSAGTSVLSVYNLYHDACNVLLGNGKDLSPEEWQALGNARRELVSSMSQALGVPSQQPRMTGPGV